MRRVIILIGSAVTPAGLHALNDSLHRRGIGIVVTRFTRLHAPNQEPHDRTHIK
jgi:hypothetical protein